MSWINDQFALKLFNFYGITNSKFHKTNHSLQVSKWQILINGLKLSFYTFFAFAVNKKSWLKEKELRDDFDEVPHQSEFSERVTKITSLIFYVLIFLTLLLEILKCRKITKFVDDARKLILNEENWRKLKKFCLINVAILMFYWTTISALILFVFGKFYLLTILIFFLTVHLNATAFVCVFFIKCVEDFLVVNLMQINEELINGENLQKSLEKFLKVAKLFEDFKTAFGLYWTLNTSSITMYLTLYVIL